MGPLGTGRAIDARFRSAAGPLWASRRGDHPLLSESGATILQAARRSGMDPQPASRRASAVHHDQLHRTLDGLIQEGRRASARAVNAVMTATCWLIGRHIVEFEQRGKNRAARDTGIIEQLAADLTATHGRGHGVVNLAQMRRCYLSWPTEYFWTVSENIDKTLCCNGLHTFLASSDSSRSRPSWAHLHSLTSRFLLPWSAYVRLLGVKDAGARRFHEAEALRGGWTVRQLDRQIDSMFYERTALSGDQAKLLRDGARSRPADSDTSESMVKDPFVLEFLGLRDEHSASDLEAALIQHLERFLLELGGDFAFVGRQRRLRVGDAWYRNDLLFYHRRLRCLVVIDLKTGTFTHADAGQMHLYVKYASEHWMLPGENPPVGLVLCASEDEAVAHFALDNLPSTVMAAEYRMALPDEDTIARELTKTRACIEATRGDAAQGD